MLVQAVSTALVETCSAVSWVVLAGLAALLVLPSLPATGTDMSRESDPKPLAGPLAARLMDAPAGPGAPAQAPYASQTRTSRKRGRDPDDEEEEEEDSEEGEGEGEEGGEEGEPEVGLSTCHAIDAFSLAW